MMSVNTISLRKWNSLKYFHKYLPKYLSFFIIGKPHMLFSHNNAMPINLVRGKLNKLGSNANKINGSLSFIP